MGESIKKTPVKNESADAPKAKRTPKPVTDLATATAAFNRAKKANQRTATALGAAEKAHEESSAALAEAARVLKGYLGDVETAVSQVVGEDNVPEGLTDADDAYMESEG